MEELGGPPLGPIGGPTHHSRSNQPFTGGFVRNPEYDSLLFWTFDDIFFNPLIALC